MESEKDHKVKAKHPVRQFFNFDSNSNTSKCNIGGCPLSTKTISGDHSGNLHRHLKRYHANESEIVESTFKKRKDEERAADSIPVFFNPKYVMDALTELTTINGRPYSILKDSGMLLLLEPILDAFKSAGIKASFGKMEVKAAGDEKLKETKSQLKNKFANRQFSLQIDMAKCENRNILGVTAQTIENGELYTKTIAMNNINDRATGVNIAKSVLKTLQEFGMSLQNCVAIASDSGANVLLAIKILKAYQSNSLDVFFEDDDEIGNDFDPEEFSRLVQSNAYRIENDCQDILTHIPCSAHTIQLAIGDALKQCQQTQSIINECRECIKKLRTPTIMNIFKAHGQNIAILDVPTRWTSEYKMLVRLRELKDFIGSIPPQYVREHSISSSTWDAVDQIIATMKPVAVAMEFLQKESITLSETFAHWSNLLLSFEEMIEEESEVELIDAFVTSFRIRFVPISRNELILASVLLDPRYHILLNETEKEKASKYLVKLYLVYYGEKTTNTDTDCSSKTPLTSLEKFLRAKEKEKEKEICTDPTEIIRAQINDFKKIERQPGDSNLFKFWEERKLSFPELYLLAQIVHSIPSTEVKVERNFSTLKFILNRLRNRLLDNELEKILLIKLNAA